MRKQFEKIKAKAEDLVRPKNVDRDAEIKETEKKVDRFKKTLHTLKSKMLPSYVSGSKADDTTREKRLKKIHEYNLASAFDDLTKDTVDSSPLFQTLTKCSDAERKIALLKDANEDEIELDIFPRLRQISDKIEAIQKQKSVESKCASDFELARTKYSNAKRAAESNTSKNIDQNKVELYKNEMDECDARLEKERDIYVSYMYDLLAEEEAIIHCLADYVEWQRKYFSEAMQTMTDVTTLMRDIKVNKKVFGTPLEEHLESTGRSIAFVIELGVCCLLEKGIYEEGLFRVGHATHKLQRIKSAIDAGIVGPQNLPDCQDPHVIAALLKNYLRSLPNPLLTYELYSRFLEVTAMPFGDATKSEIAKILGQLPKANYENLRYLISFLNRFSKQLSRTRMTTQNIAIVISPNLLWAPPDMGASYAEQVNSTAAVNTVVEQLVSDYTYFFGDEVKFYQTLPEPIHDNGGFSGGGGGGVNEEREPMTAAIKSKMSQSMVVTSQHHSQQQQQTQTQKVRTPHGSDGTSQINLQLPRTNSNNSVSDNSPPQSSPKLPSRKKHHAKPVAPVPPASDKFEGHGQAQGRREARVLQRTVSTEELKEIGNTVHNRTYESFTLGRASSARSKPSPAPRTSTQQRSVDKVYENSEPLVFREKPAIPERPANLPVRPTSKPITDFNSLSPDAKNDHEPMLKQAQISTIEKQQVSIIDLGHKSSSQANKKPPSGRDGSGDRSDLPPPAPLSLESNNNNNGQLNDINIQQVPRSPRGTGSEKVKRPQVTPPPPPPNRPKSVDSGTSDSTNL